MKIQILSTFLAGITTILMLSDTSSANSKREDINVNNNSLVSQATNRGTSEELMVSGTEPFWGVTISRKGIIYSTPESSQKFPYIAPSTASGRPADLVRVYRLRGRNSTNTLVIRKGSCSDGMSDINYPYSAVYIAGNTVLEGCARAK
ncbi:COG3650 family protein [Nostoc parmelioides]|uniref:COG3650 family protein n=1 Tax=Nostoc parmelioides FACHB-3921 TaxID=2692909 RepID=A0ABR8BC85_9NOSO|nr:COG3650 family protein [Nostoc parmelioides]MBD2251385.1 COG3650 family protein [Nostoc parmelioides FACHB-3921]